MEKGLIEKTGRTLEYWVDIVNRSGHDKHKEIIEFLKANHRFTHGYANFVALKAKKADAGSIDDKTLLTNQYQGKEILVPIYEKLVTIVSQLGGDVTITPKKDSVSVIRKKQFVLIKPATKTRMDLGLKLKNKPTTSRLEGSGPFGSMCTHRVRLGSLPEIDEELLCWLQEAYDQAG